MTHTRKIIGLALCIALTASFAACGKSAEKVQTPEETTAASTTAADTTTGGETTTADGTTAASTTTAGGTTTASTTTKAGETTKAGATTKAGETTKAGATTKAGEDNTEAGEETTEAPEDTKESKETSAAPAETTAAPTEAPTEEPTEAPAEQPNSELLFEFGGASINIGDNAQSFVGAVAPNMEDSAPSCYGNGEDINYYYDDFTIYVWNENGNYMTYGIDIKGAGAQTSRGITIGSGAEDVKAAYGEDYTVIGSDYVYAYGEKDSLHFTIAGDAVTAISYNRELPQKS